MTTCGEVESGLTIPKALLKRLVLTKLAVRAGQVPLHVTSVRRPCGAVPSRGAAVGRCPNVSLTSSLRDGHCYFFARWVLDLLVAQPTMSSIQVGDTQAARKTD